MTTAPNLPIDRVKREVQYIWSFRDDAFQSEMLPDLADLGFDYISHPQYAADGYDVLLIAIDGDQVAIPLTATRDAPDSTGLELRLRQLCTDCQLEFLALAPS
jgi:hypothetical protein